MLLKLSTYIIILILLLSSCIHEEDIPKKKIVKSFKTEENLSARQISLPNKKILSVDNICIADSLLLIKTSDVSKKIDKYFVVYSVKRFNKSITFNYIGEFGNKGKGPNEFINPHFNNQIIVNNNSVCIWVHDLDKYTFYLINVSSSARSGRTKILKQFIEPKMIDLGMHVFVLPNSDMVGTSFSYRGRLFYYSSKKKKVIWSDLFPKVNITTPKDLAYFLYEGVVRIKPDQTKIVSALFAFKELDFFNVHAEPEFSIVFNKHIKSPNMLKNPEDPLPDDLQLYYNDLVLTDSYIYALLSEMTNYEYNEDLYDNVKSIVQVFDWNGKPVARYNLDKYYDKITIDEKGKHIIAYSRNYDETIFLFDFMLNVP